MFSLKKTGTLGVHTFHGEARLMTRPNARRFPNGKDMNDPKSLTGTKLSNLDSIKENLDLFPFDL